MADGWCKKERKKKKKKSEPRRDEDHVRSRSPHSLGWATIYEQSLRWGRHSPKITKVRDRPNITLHTLSVWE